MIISHCWFRSSYWWIWIRWFSTFSEILLAITSVLAIVSLSFSVTYLSQRHSLLLPCSYCILHLFVACLAFEKECYFRYHSFSFLFGIECAFVGGVDYCFLGGDIHTCFFEMELTLILRRRGSMFIAWESSQILWQSFIIESITQFAIDFLRRLWKYSQCEKKEKNKWTTHGMFNY